MPVTFAVAAGPTDFEQLLCTTNDATRHRVGPMVSPVRLRWFENRIPSARAKGSEATAITSAPTCRHSDRVRLTWSPFAPLRSRVE
jgi:hypothetical protein